MGDNNPPKEGTARSSPPGHKQQESSVTTAASASESPSSSHDRPPAMPFEESHDANGTDRTDGQTSVRTNESNFGVETTTKSTMTSSSTTSCANPQHRSASWLPVPVVGDTHRSVNVDPAHSSCSAEAGTATATLRPRPQLHSEANEDSEMAIVSESMAHASITPANATKQRPTGAVEETPVNATASTTTGSTVKAVEEPAVMAPLIKTTTTTNQSKARKKKRPPPAVQPGQSSGRWTHAEHEAFLEGLKVFGREWKKVAVRIPTRTSAQVRSHAQKYFSKLSRDEQLMHQESQAFEAAAAAAAAAAGSSASTASHAESTAAEATAAAQAFPPAVQRNVQRILADPEQAQRDVEDTLRALRERYQQLQLRLREHQAQNGGDQESPSHLIEEEKEEPPSQPPQPQQQQHGNDPPRGGKRRRGESGDDCSMSSSTLSSLGNEELIALSVLGATLPNGRGGQQQPPAPARPGPGLARQRSNSSLDSHSISTTSSSKSAKRRRDDAA